MKWDSIQVIRMDNGYLVSYITKGNQFSQTPPSQVDRVFLTLEAVLTDIAPKTTSGVVTPIK